MRILCFGDSNTYGYDPRSFFGDQYPAQNRWVDLLARKLGCKVVNAGENGREIPHRESELLRFDWMMQNQRPVDLLIVMLGFNDLLQGNGVTDVVRRMESFLRYIKQGNTRILLIAPPSMQPGAWVTTQSLVNASKELSHSYKLLAERLGIPFVDAGEWAIPMTFDGVHFTEDGHRAFAEEVYNYLNKGD